VQIQNAGTGTAVAGTHFTNPPYPQTLSWANGEGGTKCGSVAIVNVAGSQASRTINYTLGGATGGATLGSQTTHTLTITDVNLVAMKNQPGVYAAFNKQCIPWDGVRYGCSTSELLAAVANEVCPNSYIQGMKIIALPSFFISNTPGVYTGSVPGGGDLGFAIVDPVLDALAACGKFLILQGESTFQVDIHSATPLAFPTFTYPSSWDSTGTASGSNYGLVQTTQASQPAGMQAQLWHTDWRDLASAANTAYCNRYAPGGAHPSNALYAINVIYWNTSLPINAPLPPGYDEAAFNNYYRDYVAAARAACPTINVTATLDYANPHPAQMSTWLASLQSSGGAMANTDVGFSGPSWGQSVYAGQEGSPSIIDYRGVVRNFEEVESPDMCGRVNGNSTPAQFYDNWANGNANTTPRRPSTIVVYMASECPAGYNWQAWKDYLATLGGATVFIPNGGATRRTPAYVKANFCETEFGACQ
jgi:hypothetical protein